MTNPVCAGLSCAHAFASCSFLCALPCFRCSPKKLNMVWSGDPRARAFMQSSNFLPHTIKGRSGGRLVHLPSSGLAVPIPRPHQAFGSSPSWHSCLVCPALLDRSSNDFCGPTREMRSPHLTCIVKKSRQVGPCFLCCLTASCPAMSRRSFCVHMAGRVSIPVMRNSLPCSLDGTSLTLTPSFRRSAPPSTVMQAPRTKAK